MPAYSLDTLVTILRDVRTPGSDFEYEPPQWSKYATAWVQFVPRRGTETVEGDQVTDRVQATVYTRFDPKVEAGMRLVYGDVEWDVTSVIDIDNRHEYLELMVSECQMS